MSILFPRDPWLEHAKDIIFADFGVKVKVEAKNKDLLKFGRSLLIGTSKATIQHQPAGILHETYVSDNLINTIISTSVADDQDVKIEMHSIADGVFTFFVQSATLNGRTAVPITPGARVSRVYNDDATEMAGVISVTETDTYTDGVPATDTKVHLQIAAGMQNSEKVSTTLSNVDFWVITQFYGDVLKKQAAFAEVDLEFRLVGKVFRDIIPQSASNNHSAEHPFKPYFILPPNSDIRLVAKADSSSTELSGGIDGVLLKAS